ncbi:MAG: hypothetical protein J6O73_10720 [Lachnospiraceae bacterium]|nr:hypothetical protein [Lachnospiraceae bacterium]
MAFNKDYILEKIADTEDGEHSFSDLMTKEGMPEDVPEEMKKMIDMVGNVVSIDYADLGEDSYDAYGLYSFAPDDPEDPSSYLSVVLTLTDHLNPIGMTSLYQIVNRINARIPIGAFAVSEDETTLFYRNSIQIHKELGDDAAAGVTAIGVLQSLVIVTEWIDVLMGLNDGTLGFEECIERTKVTAEV